jgi:hypothetical protein
MLISLTVETSGRGSHAFESCDCPQNQGVHISLRCDGRRRRRGWCDDDNDDDNNDDNDDNDDDGYVSYYKIVNLIIMLICLHYNFYRQKLLPPGE